MPFTFQIDKPKDVIATFKNLKIRVEKNKGKLSGDYIKGYISSDGVEGSYLVLPESIEITIHKKPLLIHKRLIENEIKKIFCEISS